MVARAQLLPQIVIHRASLLLRLLLTMFLCRADEIMLLEAFQKKDQRDEAFAAVVAAASEFDLDLSDREGAWCDHSQVAWYRHVMCAVSSGRL